MGKCRATLGRQAYFKLRRRLYSYQFTLSWSYLLFSKRQSIGWCWDCLSLGALELKPIWAQILGFNIVNILNLWYSKECPLLSKEISNFTIPVMNLRPVEILSKIKTYSSKNLKYFLVNVRQFSRQVLEIHFINREKPVSREKMCCLTKKGLAHFASISFIHFICFYSSNHHIFLSLKNLTYFMQNGF